MVDYNVTVGEDFATIAALSGETKVIFSFTPNLIAVKATGDDASITVARFAGAQSGDDGVRTITSGESTTLEPYNGDKFVYVNGTGGVEVWAGRAGEEIPPSFKKSAKGGESGGGTHYRGTTTTALTDGSTTNPITINGEEYTAVFGDIVVYSSSEFIFDGTAWSEFGRPYDTTPTSGSANAVTSDGIAAIVRNGTGGSRSVILGASPYSTATSFSLAFGNACNATGDRSIALGDFAVASGSYSTAIGLRLNSSQTCQFSTGKYNKTRVGDLFNVGNGTAASNRSNILEANSTSFNVNGDIQRDGVGIDDYTTTERKIGKWIDGSDLYQRTFEVTTGLANGVFNPTVLGTTGISIVYYEGYVYWNHNGEPDIRVPLNYYSNVDDRSMSYVTSGGTDIGIRIYINDANYTIDKAIVTIKYTKTVVNNLSNNIQTVSEPNEEPTEGEDMRSEPVEEISR